MVTGIPSGLRRMTAFGFLFLCLVWGVISLLEMDTEEKTVIAKVLEVGTVSASGKRMVSTDLGSFTYGEKMESVSNVLSCEKDQRKRVAIRFSVKSKSIVNVYCPLQDVVFFVDDEAVSDRVSVSFKMRPSMAYLSTTDAGFEENLALLKRSKELSQAVWVAVNPKSSAIEAVKSLTL